MNLALFKKSCLMGVLKLAVFKPVIIRALVVTGPQSPGSGPGPGVDPVRPYSCSSINRQASEFGFETGYF